MFKKVGDLNVHYEVSGQGPPLVLVHGGGSRASAFEEMVPTLAKSFTVYIYDQRGFGETQRPPELKLTHPLWREDLQRIVDSLGLKQFALGGWSLGGGVCLDYTVHNPQRVTQLILIGTGSPRLERSDRSGFDRRRQLIEAGAKPEQIVAETFEFTKKAFSPYSIEHNPKAVESIRQEHLRNNPQSYLEMLKANENRPKIGDRLKEIACPTLVLCGEHDGRTPLPMSEDLNKAIPSSYLKIVPNCGHFYGFEQPEFTSHAMVEFLKAFGAVKERAGAR